MRRREFIELVGCSMSSIPAQAVNSAQVSESISRTAPASSTAEASFTVSGGNIAVQISKDGRIIGAILASKNLHRTLEGWSRLDQCELNGQVTSAKVPNGGLEFKKPISFQRGFRGATLVERFLPATNGVRWEIEIHNGTTRSPWWPYHDPRIPWSTGIETHLKWAGAKSLKFWTSWGDNYSSRIAQSMDSSGMGWIDPTVPQPFRTMQLSFGGFFVTGTGFSVPIATVIEEAADLGVSLVLSPEDALLDLELRTSEEGFISFSRLDNKICKERPVRFAMDLIAHEGDWRPALSWMVERYPDYFNPRVPLTYDVGGGGAYSAFTGDLDPAKFKKMAYKVNWLASFDFPWYGMYLPPVSKDTEWMSLYGKKLTSKRNMDDYCRRMREMGFHVLCYFNITEVGYKLEYPPPLPKEENESELWKNPSDYVYKKLASGILYSEDGTPYRSGDGTIVVDPADPACENFFLEQAERHVKELPHASGICIDELVWMPRFNYRADDGQTWVNNVVGNLYGIPARSFINSYKEVLGKIGQVMHSGGKVLYVNPHVMRLDTASEVDGFFHEHGFLGFNLNQISFLALLKPVVAWTVNKTQLRPDPDTFFQRYLFMGAFPMVPYPENDHSIVPNQWAERYYMDYGPLLNELSGRKWVLVPHVIEVKHSVAKANIFATPRGFALPVTFGGDTSSATVIVRGLPPAESPQDYHIEAILPGSSEWNPVQFRRVGKTLAITLQLARGCAMVRLVRKGRAQS